MQTIYKYKLELLPVQEIEAPRDIKWLTVQLQAGQGIMVWGELHVPEKVAFSVKHIFYLRGTGHKWEVVPYPSSYLNTVQMSGFVWHVFVEPLEV